MKARSHRRLAFAAAFTVALAATPGAASETRSPRWHLFFGLDGAEDSYFGHGGLVWAPVGDLDHTGWRLRASVNGGQFNYLAGTVDITGRLLSAEVMPGFQWIGGNMGLTVYGGPTVQDQTTEPYDPGKTRQGTRLGAKVLVEGWLRLTDTTILNGSACYATAAETYCARIAASVDVAPNISLEPEIAAFGEPGYDQQRYGLLVGFRPSPAMQIKAGGGWAVEPDADGPYVAVQVKIWK
ncbi:cellulose biosynthesis protein BcsS [Microbaculum marinisediminis]|uniref:Cellulose biosynthesis protein BcsS n=1 Tax=Microbaculum marinisediminis TaxID=2931392 RepID=A0AAW5QV30_9HYPH|nr:cellulose biosynthesis protein BcsS [Microbaculum sp. A6E488]MCT8970411.1 cellulose biosynthesis protein BcsS [Microbaculum sp. A6E488]